MGLALFVLFCSCCQQPGGISWLSLHVGWQRRLGARPLTNDQLLGSPGRVSLILNGQLRSICRIIDHIHLTANEGQAYFILLALEADATGLIYFSFFKVEEGISYCFWI